MKIKLMVIMVSVALLAGAALHFSPGQAAQATPEVIDDGHYLAGNGSDIIYTTNGNEAIFCVSLKGDVFGRVPYGGGRNDRDQLLINCDAAPFPDRAMVSTLKETYFITGAAQGVDHALYVRPADGSGPAINITNDQNIAPRALAIDATHVYYVILSGTSSQIVRRHLDSGAVETVAPVGDMVDMINGLAVDDANIFWTEGFPGSSGRVRRAPKTGGVPALVADGLDFPVSIVLDGILVYWAEEEGHRIGRRLKGGIGITQTIYTTDRPVTALDIHDNIVYFGTGTTGTSNGSLWRVSVDGQNPTLMAYGFGPPRGILWAGGWVYWVDGKLRRLSPKAVSDPVDYAVEHIEVTQGVQDGDHTMPLVAGQPTMVRVYAREILGTSDDIVSARLYGYRNGIPLPGSPLAPVMYGKQDLDSDLPGRGDADQTHTFQLPAAWLMGDPFQLQAEINPGPQVFEIDFTNNRYPKNPQMFETIFRLACLTTYPVAAVADDGSTAIFSNDPAVYDPRMERAKLLLPTGVHVDKMDTVVYAGIDEEGNGIPHNLVASGGEAALLAALVDSDVLSDPTPGCQPPYTRVGGLVDIDATNPPNFGGRANDEAFWARWWESDSDLPYVQPAGSFLWAHEFAHTLDRPHVDCGGAAGPGFYPYADPCTNGDTNDFDASWGYDLITGTALDPLTHRDLMAYGSQRWVSDYTWRCLSDFIGAQWGLPGMGTAGCDDPMADAGQNSLFSDADVQNSAASPTAGPVLTVSGAFRPITADFNPPPLATSTHVTTSDPDFGGIIAYPDPIMLTEAQNLRLTENPNTGPWQIVVLDNTGQPLSSKYIQPDGDIHDSEDHASTGFSVALPLPAGADRYEIRETVSGDLLYEKTRGKSRPEIQRPTVEVNSDGDLVASFSAQDADAEPLSIIAQYIEPGGRKQLLAYTPHSAGGTFSCDPCVWPGRTLHGGDGHVRLLVSDGFDSVWVDLPIAIPTKAPEVSVHAVQVGPLDENGLATYRLSTTIWDAEDRSPLAVSPGLQGFPETADQPVIRYEWQVNGIDNFAVNEPVIFLSQEILALEDGDPTVLKVAVSATDSNGQSSTKTLEVDLQPPASGGAHTVFLPIIQVGD